MRSCSNACEISGQARLIYRLDSVSEQRSVEIADQISELNWSSHCARWRTCKLFQFMPYRWRRGSTKLRPKHVVLLIIAVIIVCLLMGGLTYLLHTFRPTEK
jgi:hypothetical protein